MQREHDFEECSLHVCWAVQLLRLSSCCWQKSAISPAAIASSSVMGAEEVGRINEVLEYVGQHVL